VSVRGLCRERRYAGEVYFSTSVQTGISRVTSNINSCSYTQCVYLFPTLHTNRHSTRREFTSATQKICCWMLEREAWLGGEEGGKPGYRSFTLCSMGCEALLAVSAPDHLVCDSGEAKERAIPWCVLSLSDSGTVRIIV